MTQETINYGTAANDGTGDTWRALGQKVNNMFTEIYTTLISRVSSKKFAATPVSTSGLVSMRTMNLQDLPVPTGSYRMIKSTGSTTSFGSTYNPQYGNICRYYGLALPQGWLLCDGTVYNYSSGSYTLTYNEYSNLYFAIEDTYGAGTGSFPYTFKVPHINLAGTPLGHYIICYDGGTWY